MNAKPGPSCRRWIPLATGMVALLWLPACDRPAESPNLEGRPAHGTNTGVPGSRGSTPESPGTKDAGAPERELGQGNPPGGQ